MSHEIRIRSGNAEDLEQLRTMWVDLYRVQQEQGMQVRLPDDAFERWTASMRPGLGRFTCLFLAESDAIPVGFLAGRVRAMPPYFGGIPVGFISEVYVDSEHRGAGAGTQLMKAATGWFHAQGIVRLELQVLMRNESARRVYRNLGWTEELVQMVLIAEPS